MYFLSLRWPFAFSFFVRSATDEYYGEKGHLLDAAVELYKDEQDFKSQASRVKKEVDKMDEDRQLGLNIHEGTRKTFRDKANGNGKLYLPFRKRADSLE